MQPFVLTRSPNLIAASRAACGTDLIAGGTDMLPLMKENLRRPSHLVDVTALLGQEIQLSEEGARIAAGATMESVATHPGIAAHFPVLSQALLQAASVQVRNLATVGGTLLQRTRCPYFRDAGVTACNKRDPGSGCAALHGENRILAVLGTSEHCIATQPSDMAVALVALEAALLLRSALGERRIRVEDLHRLPGEHPDQETILHSGEIITAIEIPASRQARHSVYLKVRDRAAFEWALLSAAVALDVEGGIIRTARVAMGGVGTKPWRMRAVEAALEGGRPGPALYREASGHAMQGAQGHGGNDFKITAAPLVLARALELAGETVRGEQA